MPDLRIINSAVFDAVAEFPNVRYVIITWEGDRCIISSNQTDEGVVLARLLMAAKLLTSADLVVVDGDEVMGHA